MKVLVLGHKGMLGHMVVRYLTDNKFNVSTTESRWPDNKAEITEFDGDYIINCIGAIPQKTDDFDINWVIPIWLDLHAPCKIIHPGTDCEMDDDNYGISKRIAANYIKEHGKQTKSIKTSIIGPELDSNDGLFEWFLTQEETVSGYTKAIWNGNTTLEWAKYCEQLMNAWTMFHGSELIISTNSISKYKLLHEINNIFEMDIEIIKEDIGKDKSLKGIVNTGDIRTQLEELKKYYYDS